MSARLAAAALALALATPPAIAQTPARPDEPGRITVVGRGEVRAQPDMATITVGVTAQARQSREALAQVTRTMTQATEALRQAGIQPRDLQTSGFQVAPQYETAQNRPPRIVGTQVSAELIVQVRDLTTLGDMLDRVVQLGANRVDGPEFGLADPEAALDGARRAAVADALRRARAMTEALGVRLGRVVSVEEGARTAPVRRFARAAPAAMAPAPVPVEAGEETIRSDVTVVWELQQ
jgi:uncharacterized protein YggE